MVSEENKGTSGCGCSLFIFGWIVTFGLLRGCAQHQEKNRLEPRDWYRYNQSREEEFGISERYCENFGDLYKDRKSESCENRIYFI